MLSKSFPADLPAMSLPDTRGNVKVNNCITDVLVARLLHMFHPPTKATSHYRPGRPHQICRTIGRRV